MASSEKWDKKKHHRRVRKLPNDHPGYLHPKKFESNWGWAKDGKGWVSKKNQWLTYTNEEYRKMMKK